VKAAVASVVSLAAMLLVILVALGADSDWLLVGVVWLGVFSIGFALVAVGGALRGKDESAKRLLPLLIALPVLGVFALAIFALLTAFGNAFE
jgi:hypothetical protein